jgi:cell wall-associated NlpC family hydrolase
LRGLRLLVPALVVIVVLLGTNAQPAAAATSEAGAVMDFAKAQLGKPWVYAATGLKRYDCSGLVYRTFVETGLLDRVGGQRRTASGFFKWFKNRGLLTKSPKVGDLVTWGSPVTHIGIFAGYNSNGKPMAVSTLYNGVSQHTVGWVYQPLKAYLRVSLSR